MQVFGKDPVAAQTIYYKIVPGRKYRLSFFMKTEKVIPAKQGGGPCANFANNGNNWFPQRKPVGPPPGSFMKPSIPAKRSKKEIPICGCVSSTVQAKSGSTMSDWRKLPNKFFHSRFEPPKGSFSAAVFRESSHRGDKSGT